MISNYIRACYKRILGIISDEALHELERTFVATQTAKLYRALSRRLHLDDPFGEHEDSLCTFTQTPVSVLRDRMHDYEKATGKLAQLAYQAPAEIDWLLPVRPTIDAVVTELCNALKAEISDIKLKDYRTDPDHPGFFIPDDIFTESMVERMPLWQKYVTGLSGHSSGVITYTDGSLMHQGGSGERSCVEADIMLNDSLISVLAVLETSGANSRREHPLERSSFMTIAVPGNYTTYIRQKYPTTKQDKLAGIRYYVPWLDEMLALHHLYVEDIRVPRGKWVWHS